MRIVNLHYLNVGVSLIFPNSWIHGQAVEFDPDRNVGSHRLSFVVISTVF